MLHTCQTDLTRNALRKLSLKVIAEHFSKRLVHEGAILKPRAMIVELLRDYGVEIEYGVALRARKDEMDWKLCQTLILLPPPDKWV